MTVPTTAVPTVGVPVASARGTTMSLGSETAPSVPEAVPLIRWAAVGYVPNGWAYRHVHTNTARFIAGVTSRQVGKTTTGEAWIDEAMQTPADAYGPPEVGVLSFDYAHSWMPVERWLMRVRRADGHDRYYVNKNEHVIRDRLTGATLRWFSADDPFAIAGYTLSHVLIDESQKVPDDVWAKARPTFNVRRAKVLAFGTPDITPDQTWFRGLFERGQENDPNYHSFTVSCFENRWITLDEIRDARTTLTTDEFRMLYLGQWVSLGGEVFRRYKHCFNAQWQEPQKDGVYGASLDIAKENDYTVLLVADLRNNTVVHEYRVNQLDYVDLEDEIERVYRQYRCQWLVSDTTGVGEPVADALRHRGLVLRPFVFSAKSKGSLVSNLARVLEHGQIAFPRDYDGLRRELAVYKRKVTPAGNVQFTAPVNYFDDRIMAAGMLANQLRRSGYVSGESITESYATFGGSSPW